MPTLPEPEPEPEPEPWPGALGPLMALPAMAACLEQLGLACLADCCFLDKGSALSLQSALEQAVGAAVARKKAASTLDALLLRVGVFQAWDTNGDGQLDFGEVEACVERSPEMQAAVYSDGAQDLRSKFRAMDSTGSGALSFADFFHHSHVDQLFFALLRGDQTSLSPPPREIALQDGSARRIIKLAETQPTASQDGEAALEADEDSPLAQESRRSSASLNPRLRGSRAGQRRVDSVAPRLKRLEEARGFGALELPEPAAAPMTPMGEALASVFLGQFEAPMMAEGYALVEDLAQASERDLGELEDVLLLQPPERRRLRKLAQNSRPGPQPEVEEGQEEADPGRQKRDRSRTRAAQKRSVPTNRGSSLARAAPAARRAVALRQASAGLRGLRAFQESGRPYNGMRDDDNKGRPFALDDRNNGRPWHVRYDDEGRPYYVSADPKVASTYEVPEDYTGPDPTRPRRSGVCFGLVGNATQGDVVGGETPKKPPARKPKAMKAGEPVGLSAERQVRCLAVNPCAPTALNSIRLQVIEVAQAGSNKITVSLPEARHARLTRRDGLQHSQVSVQPLNGDAEAKLLQDLELPEGATMAGPMTEFLPHGAPRRLNINRDLSRRWIGCDRLQLHTAGGSEDGCVRYTDEGRQQSRQLRGERGPGLPPQTSPRRTVDATGRAREGYGKSNVGIVIFRFASGLKLARARTG